MEVKQTNKKAYSGCIFFREDRDKWCLRMNNSVPKICKHFDSHKDAFEFMVEKNYELNKVKNRIFVYADYVKVHIKDDIYCYMDNTNNTFNILDKYILDCPKKKYIRANKGEERIYLHHLLLGFSYDKETDKEIDHKNNNPRDNRMTNLRAVSHSVNMINTRRMKKSNTNERNIHWDEKKKYYMVRWQEEKITKSKSFTISKYHTKENALQEAVQFRNDYVYQLPDYKLAQSI